ncbi:MAG: hypothetical protein M0P31_13900 [Solirubrobacteraceae bacterium]|nr:hypothetical protein [Solirubrobacteraceae bacterium]
MRSRPLNPRRWQAVAVEHVEVLNDGRRAGWQTEVTYRRRRDGRPRLVTLTGRWPRHVFIDHQEDRR